MKAGGSVPDIRRVAMISLHTSPLDQPGIGDAGGMNVYVLELARRLATRGIEVDIFTRATTSALEPTVLAAPTASWSATSPPGPSRGSPRASCPASCASSPARCCATEAAQPLGHYDAVHSHYWLSGQVGALARDRWGVPLVHSMHTMAKVKNDALADGDTPEPEGRHDRRGAGRRGRRHADRQHRPRGQAADQPVRRRSRSGRGGAPRRRPRRVPTPRQGRACAASSACRSTPTCCCSPAGSSRSRRPTCCCGRSRCCSSGGPSCGRGWSSPSSAGRPAPASSTPRRWPTCRPTLGLRRRGPVRAAGRPGGAESTGARRPTWSPYRPTTSRSGWSPSRPRPPAPRSSPPRSAASPPWSATASPGCWSTATTPPPGRPRSSGSSATRRSAAGSRPARSSTPAASPGTSPPTGRSTSTSRRARRWAALV